MKGYIPDSLNAGQPNYGGVITALRIVHRQADGLSHSPRHCEANREAPLLPTACIEVVVMERVNFVEDRGKDPALLQVTERLFDNWSQRLCGILDCLTTKQDVA